MPIPYSLFIENCIERAYQISIEYKNGFIGTEHMLWAMIYEEGVLFKMLTDFGVDPDEISKRLESSMDDCKNLSPDRGPQTPRLQRIFALASKYASDHFLKEVEEENLILAILDSGYGTALRAIASRVSDLGAIRSKCEAKYADKKPNIRVEPIPISGLSPAAISYIPHAPIIPPSMMKRTSSLESPLQMYSRDLTSLVISGKIGEIEGRQKEISDICLSLMKTKTNNPVIVGERGSGRTSTVEGAVLFMRLDGSSLIRNSRVIEITRNKVLQVLGDTNKNTEKQFREFLRSCSFPKCIVVLDSVMELADEDRVTWNLLSLLNDIKQMIEEQTLRTIMITTPGAYEKVYRKDPVLSVCCEKIDLKELPAQVASRILKKERENLSCHYGIAISPDCVDKAVELADEHIKGSCFPMKGFQLLDEACAMASVANEAELTEEMIMRAAAKQSGLSMDKIRKKNVGLKSMNEVLKRQIIGQDEAIDRVCDRIRLFMAGLNNEKRPLGVFFFAGPTGVGKTELAKVIAKEIFGSEEKLFRFDMSEYSQPHEVARLIGAPPGYVGYTDEGQLTGAVRKEPNCVVLLDEFEKANEKIFNIFLQVFDAGRLTDGKGQSVDFRNSLIIMTSNVGADIFREGLPADVARARLLEALKARFSMEFINRIDDLILFNHLKDEDIVRICRLMTDSWCEKIEKNNIRMIIEDNVISALCAESYDREFGVRNMKRIIEEALIIPVSRRIVDGNIPEGTVLRAVFAGDRIDFIEEEPSIRKLNPGLL